MRGPKYPIKLAEEERIALERLAKNPTTAQQIALRARIILLADSGMKHQEIAEQLTIGMHVITRWTQRWLDKINDPIAARLQDSQRSGRAPVITPPQVCKLVALACENPQAHGVPITHWTHRELAREAISQGIVERISASQVGRILKKRDIQPHRIRYWLNAKADDRKAERIADICELYGAAQKKPDEIILSVDEMTGIQALERIAE